MKPTTRIAGVWTQVQIVTYAEIDHWQKAKKTVIGEAGIGHSFTSEGPFEIAVGGKSSPLLSKTIFASKIQENILSVGEATYPYLWTTPEWFPL